MRPLVDGSSRLSQIKGVFYGKSYNEESMDTRDIKVGREMLVAIWHESDEALASGETWNGG